MLTRHLLETLEAALADTPAVLLQGARQVGKSTLAEALAGARPQRAYRTFDDGSELAAALASPDGYVRGFSGPVALDEIQRAPELFRAIKASVDRDRTAGRFLLTGSANVLLLPRLSESLAGRIEILTLWPLSQGEIDGVMETFVDRAFGEPRPNWSVSKARASKAAHARNASPTLAQRIVRGGFPEPMTRATAARRASWYASYVDTNLRRDIRDLANIDGLREVPKLLALVASRVSGLLNLADLSRGLALPQTSLKRYFTLLEALFLVTTLPAWTTNRGLRLVKAPKVFLTDTGLASHLVGADAATLEADGRIRGILLENFVVVEILKQLGWCKVRPTAHHFRSTSGVEVDIVLEDRAGRIVGIEVKSCATVNADDFRGLRMLRETAGKKFVRGIVLHDGESTVHFDEQFLSAPISALWSA